MFTGIITDIGKIRSIEVRGDTRIAINTSYNISSIEIGSSISCSGVCLTVVDKDVGWFAVDVSKETLDRTNLGGWEIGSLSNLERALRVGDELGGHIVTGHIDCVVEVADKKIEGDSIRYQFHVSEESIRNIAPKGSVALDGISLTVNDVSAQSFGVNIIPHTQEQTTFHRIGRGDKVNLEIDVLARYVARLVAGDFR